VKGAYYMKNINNSKGTPSKDTGSKNNNSDNDVDYKNSFEIENPNPSTATPTIPSEMPAREENR
jgi:hypothetical protein